MTEAEWRTCADPGALLRELEGPLRVLQFKGGRRKARLMACAWCRPLLAYVRGEWGAAVVELVERFADGVIGKAELATAREVARENALGVFSAYAKALSTAPEAVFAAERLKALTAQALVGLPAESSPAMLGNLPVLLAHAGRLDARLPDRCDVVREVFGNPYRPAPISPAWRRRNDGAACKLAEAIYANRAFDEVPVLADALEDAGCADEAILGHLRSPGPHVRGCWVVDAVLGKS